MEFNLPRADWTLRPNKLWGDEMFPPEGGEPFNLDSQGESLDKAEFLELVTGATCVLLEESGRDPVFFEVVASSEALSRMADNYVGTSSGPVDVEYAAWRADRGDEYLLIVRRIC